MLHWSIPLIAIPCCLAVLAMSATVRNVFVVVAQTAYRVINRVGAWAAAGLDVVLRPSGRDGRTGVSRLILWSGANIAAMTAVYHMRATQRLDTALALAISLVLLHVLLLTSSILVIAEENRIMHLGAPKRGALFSPHAAVRDLTVILLEFVMALAGAAVLLDVVSSEFPGAILARTPETASSFASHLLCVLAALPGAGALVAMTEFSGDIAFGGAFGGLVRGAIYLMGSTLLYGAAAAWIYQRSATGMILARLEEADGDEVHFLQLILSRAPQHIKADLLVLALDTARPHVQLRAINVMRHLKVWTFPQTFLHNLDRFERKVKTTGLNQIREFLASDGDAFGEVLIVSGVRKAFEQYVALARSIEHRSEDAVLTRLGVLVTSYMTIIQARSIPLKTSSERLGVMLEIAQILKDVEVRRTMARMLMARCPKGFLLSYLVKMHKRQLTSVDVEIIDGFAAYVGSKPNVLSGEERDLLARRLNWNIWHAGLPDRITPALKRVLGALGTSGQVESKSVRGVRSASIAQTGVAAADKAATG